MSNLWSLLLLPLSLEAFYGVTGCLECDLKFTEDVKSLLANLLPSEVPGRTHLFQQHIKDVIHLSFKVSHSDKRLWVLDVAKVVKLRTWLKEEFYKLGNESWKGVFIFQGKLLKVRRDLESKLTETLKTFSDVACSEDCIVTEGPILDCWTCLRITPRCFKGEYCGEDSKKAENREIALFLILLVEVAVLGSVLLLFYIRVSHRRKIQTIRRSLTKYLKKKLEELVEMAEAKETKKEFGPGK
ncbi:izumo sperm-egg fusion protein 3 [Tupaia chinensis]|uniref:izumo sperm-egg fusion protein 3 n=1 Tax=Tupaia chinensis TaxID=246437 RepID=UPI0003C8C696|nr:izumo sperm-egg fusion protein 3 [Tupaia chinensis]